MTSDLKTLEEYKLTTIATIREHQRKKRKISGSKTHMCSDGEKFEMVFNFDECECDKKKKTNNDKNKFLANNITDYEYNVWYRYDQLRIRKEMRSRPQPKLPEKDPPKILTTEDYLKRQVDRRDGLQKAYEQRETDPELRQRYSKYLDWCFP